MRKLLNNPWIVAALALAAVAFVGQSLWPMRMSGTPAAIAVVADETVPLPADPAGPGVTTPSVDELTALTGSTVRRDPFAPSSKSPSILAAIEKARPDLLDTVHLSALWSQDGATYAVINGHVRLPGDEIGLMRIESATTDGVWLVHWKGRDHLALGGEFTLRTPAAGPPALPVHHSLGEGGSSSNGPALPVYRSLGEGGSPPAVSQSSPSNGAVVASSL